MKFKTLLFLFLSIFVPLTVYSFTPEDNFPSPQLEGSSYRSWLRLMEM